MAGAQLVLAKAWWKSWTIIYNGIALLGAVVTTVIAFTNDPANAGVVGAGVVAALVTVDKVINIFLRFRTDQPVSTKAQSVYVASE